MHFWLLPCSFIKVSFYEDLNLKFLFSLKAVLKFFLIFLFELWITQKRVTYPRLTSTVLLKRFWVEEQAIKIQSYYDRVRGRVNSRGQRRGGGLFKTPQYLLNNIYLFSKSAYIGWEGQNCQNSVHLVYRRPLSKMPFRTLVDPIDKKIGDDKINWVIKVDT